MNDFVYRTVCFGTKVAARAMGARLRIEGREQLPSHGGAVIVCNHISYLDPFLVAVAARRRVVRFPTLQPWFDKRLTGPILREMRQIPITGDAGSAYAASLTALRDEQVVGLFAEATVAQSFTVQELRTGAVRLAREAQVPLVPTVIWGSHRLWTKNRRNLSSRGIPITVRIGTPWQPDGIESVTVATHELRDRMQLMLDRAQRECPDAGHGQWWQPAHLGGTAPTPAEAALRDAVENARS